ncbi:MAG: FHA domain-containing protein [Oligoflexia bacterium]|nr:FHA domain-containing protein [Oligoflexia bacterium]
MKRNVVHISDGDATKAVEVDLDEFIVGRDESAAVRLSIPAVSRRHVLVRVSKGVVYIRDLGSANGTFLGSTRLNTNEEVRLTDPGEQVSLGNAVWISIEPRNEGADVPVIENYYETGSRELKSDQIQGPVVRNELSKSGLSRSHSQKGPREPSIRKLGQVDLPLGGTRLELEVPAAPPSRTQMEAASRALIDQCEALKHEIFALRKERVQCERELATKRKSLEDDLNDLKEERAAMERGVARSREEMQNELEELKKQHEQSVESKKQAIEELDSERGRTERVTAELRERRVADETDYEEKKAAIEESMASLVEKEAEAKRALEASMASLAEEEAEAKRALEAVLKQRDEVVTEMEDLKDAARNAVEAATDDLKLLQAQAEIAKKDAREGREQASRLREDSEAIAAEISDFRERREKIKAQVAGLEEERTRLETTLDELRGEAQKQADLRDLEVRKSKALCDTLDAELQAKKMNLEAVVGELNLRQTDSKRELQSVEEQREAVLSEIERLKAETDRQGEEIAARAAKMDELELNARQKSDEIERYKGTLAELEAARQSMEKSIDAERERRNEELQKEFTSRATQVEREIAESRLDKIKEIDKLGAESAAQLKARRESMLNEIVQGVLDLAQKEDVSGARTDLELLVRSVFEGKTVGALNSQAEARTRKFWKKTALIAAVPAVAALVLALFPSLPQLAVNQVNRTIASEKKEGSVFLDEIKKKGMKFQPPLDGKYRGTYSDNILYLEKYVEMKLSAEEKRQWTLDLNDFIVGRLGLSDRIITDFISSEAVMVTELLHIREGILPQFKEQGLARMASTEKQQASRLIELLQGQENYQKFRNFEKSFYEDYARRRSGASR